MAKHSQPAKHDPQHDALKQQFSACVDDVAAQVGALAQAPAAPDAAPMAPNIGGILAAIAAALKIARDILNKLPLGTP